jgi:eukaryotic-like serine/threonine-protein kinase
MVAGQRIGPFEIEKELGSGAMGTVYRARYLEDDRLVALKLIAFGLAGNDSALARFEREAIILKQLKHPNIVRRFATGKWRGTPFFAMEYVDGESLDRIIARRDRFTWQEVIDLGKQLCSALQHAHDKGIIHRDIKPSNLMLTQEGLVKLTDFGIAKDIDVTALTGANNTIGTASYMSPEQCKGERALTSRSDLYSLGVVFFELLSGHKPFIAESSVDMFMMHVNEPPPRVRGQPGCLDVPQGLDTLVHQLMDKKPEHRPRDATMVAQALEEIERNETERLSRGEQVAKSRLVDAVEMAPMDQTDKEAALSIRAAAKKKKLRKKQTAVYRQGWFVAAGSVLLLAAMALIAWLLLRPESADEMVEAVRNAKSPEARLEAAKRYLDVYGKRDDPKLADKTALVRDIYWEARVRRRETVLVKRHQHNLRVEEGDDPDAYKQTMSAMTDEDDGNVAGARTTWKALVEEYQQNSNNDKALWGWIAAKRLRDLEQVDVAAKKVERAIEHAFENAIDVKTDDERMSQAVEAERFKRFGDDDRARERWERLARDLKGKEEWRTWQLLAGMKARELAGRRMTPGERKKMLQARLATAEAKLKKAAETGDRVEIRNERQACRDIRDLYMDEPTLKDEVQKARQLLETAKE